MFAEVARLQTAGIVPSLAFCTNTVILSVAVFQV
jgi:hypothetical protein